MTDYQAFSDALMADLAPTGMVEQQLAQRIVDLHWRMDRALALETNLLSLAHLEPAPEYLLKIEDSVVRLKMLQANSFIAHHKQLNRIQIQEERISQSLLLALKEFTALQRHRVAGAGRLPYSSRSSKNAAAA